MQTVLIIYRNRDNSDAIDHVKNNLLQVFEHSVSVENLYLNEIAQDERLCADAYLVAYEDMLYSLKNNIDNYYKVIIMNRSINRRFLPSILEIAKGTDVLVVNDSYETTIQTTYTFYELGIGHLNLIPYEESLEAAGLYQSIEIAITPDEENLVPPYIRRIINIGYREISFDTLLKLMRKLDMDTARINRNLIRHIHSVVEPNTDFHSNYLDSYLKGQMLNRIIRNSNSAIFLLNGSFQPVYANEKADLLLRSESGSAAEISDLVDRSLLHGECAVEQLIRIRDENFLFEKSPLMLMDEIMGYCVTLQNEKDLRDMEINLSSHLRQKGLYAKYHFRDIIHESASMDQCISTAKQAAVTGHTILIQGESGTGKELFAQSIHNFSTRQNSPFVAVNCAALPETLLESELFGYEGGSFTGAHRNGKPGLFEQAQTGTIFLDEIGDISPGLQSRLLRAIQEKQIMRIGSDKVIDIDIRIVAATNKDLEEEVRRGNFRSDLFYRLNVIPLFIPPLRQRKSDILPLVRHFLGTEYSKITESEKQSLLRWDWPGNVRELESAAIYYKTLGRFSDRQTPWVKKNTAPASSARTREQVSFALLRIIDEHSQTCHGIGRARLFEFLKEENQPVGDRKLREFLDELAERGFICIGKGRRGTSITESGRLWLSAHPCSEPGRADCLSGRPEAPGES